MGQEKIEYWHNPVLPNIELSSANFENFSFEPHIHLDYHIGIVTSGCQQYLHKGKQYHLAPGFISTLNPDEAHNGENITFGGYQSHVMALPVDYVNEISREMNQAETFFNAPIINNPTLSHAFLHLHKLLTTEQDASVQLQIETTMMAFITELFIHNGGVPTQQHVSIKQLSTQQLDYIKALFHDEPGQSFQLDELAQQLDLSKFQFLRQFKQSMGITPHAYLKRVRLEYAKKALMKGGNVSDVAYQVGFFDQSHFNKAFKNAYLITPSHFQRRVL
ncbi:AraC family transcriptional regulator [Moritella viscosa]|uniref:Transcriptional regulator, AraC/XylS family n=1 Tax=Moritella viscosa TaxID=80854 RepID=A0A090IBF0_9GAMM|nr:AraC family transcriptional regulator [Moritella viscosa]CED59395.1 HTH-type transcriptional regulator, AraC family [Moritella viscosa]SGY86119.1 Transcriptional regulator, AraC/XylS family [Moritella viscosa]SGY87468.1 Transcriptional regulator, AraC/XylS family [Moritella viscosa]SGY89012.1 Transcriptional regulator, AraC/XylS family [Moritella viscosa]SGY89544.1 Transcriptional regulator, AraC/XylS family [Moritella viscosa]